MRAMTDTAQEIEVSSRKGPLKAFIDAEDFDRVKGYSWCLQQGKRRGARYRYVQANISSGVVFMLHRIVMRAERGQYVDIINGNGLDCRKANLRFATFGQIMASRRKFSKTSSKYLGVHFDKSMKKWRVSINANGKKTKSPYFEKEIDAARAYNQLAKALHGERASLNNIPGEPA